MLIRSGVQSATDHPRGACPGRAELAALRERAVIEATEARRLVEHLDAPCLTCWERLRSLPRLHPVGSGPAAPPKLRRSEDPVVLALRVLGGWPPRRWLLPRRRAALDLAGAPYGFLRLAFEETRLLALAIFGGSLDLVPWLDHFEGPRDARALLVRGLLYRAEIEHSRGQATRALGLLERAAALEVEPLGESLEGIERRALRVEIEAEVIRALGSPEAEVEGRYALARRWLQRAGLGALLVESFLREARERVRRGEDADGLLDMGLELVDAAKDPMLLQGLHRVRCRAALGTAARAFPRLAHVEPMAEALGWYESCLRLRPDLCFEMADERARLETRIEELREWHDPLIFVNHVEGARHDPATEAELRIVYAGLFLGEDEAERNLRRLHRLFKNHGSMLTLLVVETWHRLETKRQQLAEVPDACRLLRRYLAVLKHCLRVLGR